MVPIFHLWLHLEDVFNWFSIYTLLFTFSQARILHLHSTQSVDIFSILPISHLWSRLHLENVRNWCRTCIVLHCRWINCAALQCEQIQNSKTQTIILKILFEVLDLWTLFLQECKTCWQADKVEVRKAEKSNKVKQSREIKQNQTKQRSQTKSNKALPKEESWILSQRPRKCRLPAMHLNLAFDSTLDLPLFVLLHFYMYLIFSNVFLSFLDQTSEIGVATATTQPCLSFNFVSFFFVWFNFVSLFDSALFLCLIQLCFFFFF